jgi:Spy/CpxP family protein refolding chaperone
MKTLLIAAAVLLSGTMFAQENSEKKKKEHSEEHKGGGEHKENHEHKTPDERANGLTNRMTEKLGLSEDQKAKIYAINLDMAKKNEAIRQNTALTKEDRRAQIKANYTERRTQYQSILTAEQFAKFEAWEKEKKAKRQENKGNGKGKGKGKGKKGTTPPPTEEEESEDEL